MDQEYYQKKGFEVLDKILSRFDQHRDLTEAQGLKIVQEECLKNQLDKFWHPSVIKFDEHTLIPGVKHVPDISKKLTEMCIVDIGPVMDGQEVDCGTSLGLSDRAKKMALVSQEIFFETKELILRDYAHLSPAAIYHSMQALAQKRGYQFIAPTAGHTLGPFPTQKREVKISPEEKSPLLKGGGWMVEVHIGNGEIGAFYENYLKIGK